MVCGVVRCVVRYCSENAGRVCSRVIDCILAWSKDEITSPLFIFSPTGVLERNLQSSVR